MKSLKKEAGSHEADVLDQEIATLCSLDHPHIVKLHEHYEDASNIYLVMDYCSGGELYSMISKTYEGGSRLIEPWVAEVMQQVLGAIGHVHNKGILHLDLKSQNIMLAPTHAHTIAPGKCGSGPVGMVTPLHRPHAMIIDLGVAQNFKPGDFRNNCPCGTPVTMA